MARKKRDLSGRERRKMRRNQIVFAIIALLVIASFVVSLVSRF